MAYYQSLNIIMKNKSIKLLGLAVILAFVSCKGNQKKSDLDSAIKSYTRSAKTVSDTTKGFTIDVPEGWQRIEKEVNGRRFIFLMGPKVNNFQVNLNILKDDMKGMGFDDYIDYNLKHMGGITPVNLKQNDIEINGMKGKCVTYSMAYQNFNLQLGSYVFPLKDGLAYIITTTEPAGDKLQFEELFAKTVRTFKID
ncbi:MAG: hypothetical protein JWQ57_4455 [Mucilaginibacter sp.]|nr:hypothetical protein [Mucilaginibacter sp.]